MANISIIIPCYNVAPYIDRCLTSIIGQTINLKELEIICVDDGSEDDTWIRLQSWEQEYPDHIVLVHCDINGRQGTARNIGLDYAHGNWISFIDADDWIEPNYFERMYQAGQKGNYDIICCQMERDFSESFTLLGNRRADKDDRCMVIDTVEKRKQFIFLQSLGCGPVCKLVRKDILIDNHIFFPENLAYEDSYWTRLLHFYIDRAYFVSEKLYHYYVNTESTVLQKNAVYHMDFLAIQDMKWKEWEKRGFLADYRDELEYDFLCDYLVFLKIIFLRFTEPPYSLYLIAKEIVLRQIPDYRQNTYVEKGLTEFYRILLESLALPLSKGQFLQLAVYAKECWK